MQVEFYRVVRILTIWIERRWTLAKQPEYLHPDDPTPQTPENATMTLRDAPAIAKFDHT